MRHFLKLNFNFYYIVAYFDFSGSFYEEIIGIVVIDRLKPNFDFRCILISMTFNSFY